MPRWPDFAPSASELRRRNPPLVTPDPASGAGLTLDERARLPQQVAAWDILTADPDSPYEGQHWIRGDLNQLRWREGATTFQVTGTAA